MIILKSTWKNPKKSIKPYQLIPWPGMEKYPESQTGGL